MYLEEVDTAMGCAEVLERAPARCDPMTYAHLFGLGAGAAVGTALAWLDVRAPRAPVQALLALVTVASLAASWALALRPWS